MGDSAYTDSDRKHLLACTVSGAFITPLMSTMMNLALMFIGDEFSVGSHDLGYVNTMFLLGSVIAMVPSARLASIYGMRKVFLLGLVITGVTSFLAMLSPGFAFFVAMRFAIGFGSAMIGVTSIAMLTYVFPRERRGWAIGINTTSVYIGLSLGPTIGGLVSDAVGWRACFVIVLALVIVSLFFVSNFRKEVTPTPEEAMDWKGSALWSVSVFVLMFGVINITSGLAAGMVVAGLGLFLVTVWYLRRCGSPVLNLRLFGIRTFSRSSVAAFMNYGASYSVAFFMSLYLQSIGALTASQAGALMLVQPAVQVLLTARMGALSDRMGDKRILPTLGMLIVSFGVAMFLFLGTEFSLPYVVLMMLIIGVGMGIFSSPNTSVIMSSVPGKYRGEASGVVSVVRQTGMMVSMSIAMASIAVIMGSTDNLGPSTYGDFVDTMRLAFSICLGMCVVGILCSWFRGSTDEECLKSI